MTNRALVVGSEEAKTVADRIKLVVPGGGDIPAEVRLGVAQLALLHGLDPFMGEIMAIKTKRGYVPYVGIAGTRRASREQIDYERVLLPLNDYWADEYFHMPEEQVRQANGMHAQDIVWFCAIYVVGKDRPFVELGVCGPGFPTVSNAPRWKIAKKRAEAAALKAACDLPFSVEGSNGSEPEIVKGSVRPIGRLRATTPMGIARAKAARERILAGGPHPSEEAPQEELPAMGNDPEAHFYESVAQRVTYFNHREHVRNTVAKLNLVYADHPQTEAGLLELLEEYANREANEKAAAEAGDEQGTLFDPEDESLPFE